jgi:ElaB/YqjD/DUF883 family membrane-anchored ribosome-binding protein
MPRMNDRKQDHDETLSAVMSDLTRLRDDLHLKIHLAGMDARDAWERLQPRLHEIERKVEERAAAAAQSLHAAASTLRDDLRGLRDDLEQTAKSSQ